MEIIIHRVNTIQKLKTIPNKYGCEIDIRSNGNDLILNHEPFEKGELFDDFLNHYNHGLLVLNIKEAGIENAVIEKVINKGIKRYFLLDVEFPYIFKATRAGVRDIAVRFSEDEPIEFISKYMKFVDWVWIDTITSLPIDNINTLILSKLKSCIVCPDRWGRPEDILPYRQKLKEINFNPSAVMTNMENVSIWELNV